MPDITYMALLLVSFVWDEGAFEVFTNFARMDSPFEMGARDIQLGSIAIFSSVYRPGTKSLQL